MANRPARFTVLLTEGAEQDLEAIHSHIAEFDAQAHANRVVGSQVIIHLIADGRRDMQSVLARRLLGA